MTHWIWLTIAVIAVVSGRIVHAVWYPELTEAQAFTELGIFWIVAAGTSIAAFVEWRRQ